MSHRNKPRSQHPRAAFPWPIVALGVILLGAAAFLLTRPGESGGTPRLAVEPQSIDYGYVKYGESRAFDIKVTNTGDGVLRFGEKPYIEVLEGC
jgi:hypothetical protein